jgi:serine/threonine-protein kinase
VRRGIEVQVSAAAIVTPERKCASIRAASMKRDERPQDAPQASSDHSSYSEHLAALGIDITQLAVDRSGTIGAHGETSVALAVDRLPTLHIGQRPSPLGELGDLQLGALISEGGMGRVSEALQIPLARRVAVKTLHRVSDASDAAAQHHLVQEATVLGALEHPNIVPVHMLGKGPDGRALMVMKYIEGIPWSELIEPLFAPGDDGDRVDEQLRILMQVCNAVQFAHARGVLHRDLKPSNVMIGSFGEVYVVDWGIAVSTRADAPGSLTPAASVRHVAGTPAYMAPEMAAAAGEHIDERTDVYLLGAILHELLTGRGPHEAPTPAEALRHAFDSPAPDFDPSVAPELGAICAQALSLDPEQRHPSAEAFRGALAEFVAHRASSQVAAEAAQRSEQLLSLLSREVCVEHATNIHHLGIEARFGFKQALRSWSANERARDGLQTLLERLIAFELERDQVDEARRLLDELPEPRPALAEQLAACAERLSAREQRLAQLEQLHHEADTHVDASYRSRLLWVLTAVLVLPIGALVALRLMGLHRAGYPEAFAIALLFAAAIGVLTRDMRRHGANEMTLRLQRAIAAAALLTAVDFLCCMLLKVDLSVALAAALLIGAATTTTMAAIVEPKLYLSGLVMGLAGLVLAMVPTLRGAMLLIGYGVGTTLAARVWQRRDAAERSRAVAITERQP